ncbi:MAG: NAD(P)H-binding protein [Deltaproteobacteria bacterium]|nr:NAD(P)H-binding protein [Deltaproteobacteria bacterium]
MGSIRKPRLVIAGASGFVGQALAPVLAERFHVVGLSRTPRAPGGGFAEYRSCDLFSLKQAEDALEGAEYAVYLVHNMMPSARLTQGDFADLDIVCADNFARAAAAAGVRQIIFLGGLCPEDQELSKHLASRREVERTLGGHVVPITTLRAGLILGGRGSSFQVMARLVRRLPLMVCPRWTNTRTQPIALRDVVALMAGVVGREDCYDRAFDIGAPDIVSYKQMMAMTADALDTRRIFIPSRVLSPGLSRLWVSLITRAPKALVAPLVESLRHEMIAADDGLAQRLGIEMTPTKEAIRQAVAELDGTAPHAFRGGASLHGPSLVRSVQRMTLPAGWTAKRAATEYLLWLPRMLSGLLRVDLASTDHFRFVLAPLRVTLLELRRAPQRSRPDRQLFYVTGGLLSGSHGRPRFELRQVLGGRTLLTVVHDYDPRLPWLIYLPTQAIFHRWLMHRFAAHLALGSARNRRVPDSAEALSS